MPREPDRRLVRLAQVLRSEIAASGVSMAAVERRLRLGHGTLSRNLRQPASLKVSLVYDVLEVIGCPPHRFFGGLHPEPPAGGGDLRVDLETLERLVERALERQERDRRRGGGSA